MEYQEIDPTAERFCKSARKVLAGGVMPMDDFLNQLAETGVIREFLNDFYPDEIIEGLDEDEVFEMIEDDLFEILTENHFWITEDEKIGFINDVTNGVVLVHRISESEIKEQLVVLTTGLQVLFPDGKLPLANGGEVSIVRRAKNIVEEAASLGALAGPQGWLSQFSPGDIVAFRQVDEQLTIEKVEQSQLKEPNGEVEAIKQAFNDLVASNAGIPIPPVIAEAIYSNRTAFREVTQPLEQILASAGLERKEDNYGRANESWIPESEIAGREAARERANRFDFTHCCHDALERVTICALNLTAGAPVADVDVKQLTDDLNHGRVVEAFAEDIFRFHPEAVDTLARMVSGANGKKASAGLYLLGKCLLLGAQVADAEKSFEKALMANPEVPHVRLELAEIASDRGDLKRAHNLFRSIGVETPEVQAIELLLNKFDGVSRNDSCPCGSGRKFKACCEQHPKIPVNQRASLYFSRLLRFTTKQPYRMVLQKEIARFTEASDGPLNEHGAEVLFNTLFFEEGILAEYIKNRAEVLSEEDLQELSLWLTQEYGLWEVISTQPGELMVLRNTKTGDERELVEKTASRVVEPGEFIITRVVQTNNQWVTVGNLIKVPLSKREITLALFDLEEIDIDDVFNWWKIFAGPVQMVNSDGEPIQFIEATLLPDDMNEFTQGLSKLFSDEEEDEEEDTDTWHVFAENGRSIRGVLEQDDDVIILRTDSENRFDEIIAMLEEGGLEFAIGEVNYEGLDDVAKKAGDSGGLESGPIPDEVIAAVQEMIRQKEQDWIDESIPALGGLTPRQALADPTRREDLLALLQEWDREKAANPQSANHGFDPDRIRVLLGITK